jgi:hypothetical protein
VREANAALLAEQRAYNSQVEEISEVRAKGSLDIQLAAIEMQEAAVQGQAKRGQITAAAEYTQLTGLLAKKLQAQMQYFVQVEALEQGDAKKLATSQQAAAAAQTAYAAAVAKAQETQLDTANSQRIAAAEQGAKGELDARLSVIATEEQAVEQQQKRGEISSQAEYTALVSLLQQKLTAQMVYYNALACTIHERVTFDEHDE